MARDRMIRFKFWDDEKLSSIPMQARLLFIGTWNIADDSGVLKGNPKYIKSQLFPYDENLRLSELKSWIDALIENRMLVPFEHSGESYLYIRNFNVHQRVDKPSKTRNVSEAVLNEILETLLYHSESRTIGLLPEVKLSKVKLNEVEVNTTRDTSIEIDFIEKFNSIKKSKFKMTSKVKSSLAARLKDGYTLEQIITAVQNCNSDQYHKENPQYLTPEFILRVDKLEKYLNYQKKSIANHQTVNQNATAQDFTSIN